MASKDRNIGDDVAKMDLYGILKVSPDATEKMIVAAYRKLALKYHPDKNPDDSAAVEMFHQISKALAVLTDKAAKAAYDQVLKARQASELRRMEMDAKRRKLRDDLEAREMNAEKMEKKRNHQLNFQAEMKRLQEEGNRLVQEEQERLKEQLKKSASKLAANSSTSPPRLKLKWKAKKTDLENGGYNVDSLRHIFCNYGEVVAVVVSSSKKGSAIVEFLSPRAAQQAYQHELGLPSNPLTITWISGEPGSASSFGCVTTKIVESSNSYGDQSSGQQQDFESLVFARMREAQEKKTMEEKVERMDKESKAEGSNSCGDQSSGQHQDFESLVFARMREAQEKKTMAEKVVQEDKDSESKGTRNITDDSN